MTTFVYITESTYIASSGSGTTSAVLTPPSGKTTAYFQSGKVSDDVNPVPALDIASDDYTELVFMFAVESSTVNTGDEIEFRITDAGSVIDSYLVVPKITAGAISQILTGVSATSAVTAALGTLINESSTVCTGVNSVSQVIANVGTLYIAYALVSPILNTSVEITTAPLSVNKVSKELSINLATLENTASKVTSVYSINKTT